jgi:hypothetical protein
MQFITEHFASEQAPTFDRFVFATTVQLTREEVLAALGEALD